MSRSISAQHRSLVRALDWSVFSSDADILKADRMGARSVLISVFGKAHSYNNTNYARILLRHSDHENSGYVNVPENLIEGGEGGDGVLLTRKTDIPSSGLLLNFAYLGDFRYIVVRFDETGALTSAPWGAAVTLSNFARQPAK